MKPEEALVTNIPNGKSLLYSGIAHTHLVLLYQTGMDSNKSTDLPRGQGRAKKLA